MSSSLPAVGSVLTGSELDSVISGYRKSNKKVVFTNGCFDLLHIGHVRYLNEASKLGDLLIVGINTDASVKRLKGPTRPIQNENDRAEILASLKSVAHTILFSEDTPLELIKRIKPSVLVKGGDWKIDQIVGAKEVLEWGGQVFSLQFVDGKSTTQLITQAQKN